MKICRGALVGFSLAKTLWGDWDWDTKHEKTGLREKREGTVLAKILSGRQSFRKFVGIGFETKSVSELQECENIARGLGLRHDTWGTEFGINVRELSLRNFFEGVRFEKHYGDWVWDKIREGTDLDKNLWGAQVCDNIVRQTWETKGKGERLESKHEGAELVSQSPVILFLNFSKINKNRINRLSNFQGWFLNHKLWF